MVRKVEEDLLYLMEMRVRDEAEAVECVLIQSWRYHSGIGLGGAEGKEKIYS